MLQVAMLIAGFALLIKGADIFVDAGIGISERLRIPKVIIGLSVVAIGTGFPEAVISITASIQGSGPLAVSNVVGSNLFNLLFIAGLCATVAPIPVKLREISVDFWVSIAAAAMLLGLMMLGGDYIPRWGSGVMMAVFLAYMAFLIYHAIKDKIELKNSEDTARKVKPLHISILLALLGCALILLGGQLTVSSSVKIAAALGITERVIGLTVVAMGTSLPELVTSLIACKKGEHGFALGNIVGSNIFNLLFILGAAGLISPLGIESDLKLDAGFLVFGSLATYVFLFSRRRLSRCEGIIMLLMYAAYMAYLIVRQVI
jgi:cation:H+ antiporter